MGWVTSAGRWSEYENDRLAACLRDNMTMNAIGETLGRTRNSVSGQINRLRVAGDPRIPTAALDPIALHAARLDRLADLMADGCVSLTDAARQLKIPTALARELWTRICARLGPQAV